MITVLYEDSDVIVVEKPAGSGIPVRPGALSRIW